MRGYLLGFAAVLVGAATAGYFYAGNLVAPLGRPPTRFPQSVVEVGNGQLGSTLLVEVADTQKRWSRGLAGREAMPLNHGMLYRFPHTIDSSWTAQGYKFPVSVALLDAQGHILRIFDLDPCPATECPAVQARIAYRGVLEVNQGWFRDNDIGVGSSVTMRLKSY
jgi:hypothetical protein